MCWGNGFVTQNSFTGDIRMLKPFVHTCPKCGGQGCPDCNSLRLDGVPQGKTALWETTNGFMELRYVCPKCDGDCVIPK